MLWVWLAQVAEHMPIKCEKSTLVHGPTGPLSLLAWLSVTLVIQHH